MTKTFYCCALLLPLALFGCDKDEAQPTTEAEATETQSQAASEASPAQEARKLYQQRCAVCHGDSGKGEGPGAAALQPKPRDYTDPEWQQTVTDEELEKVIIGGGAAVGKSPVMPPNPDLKDKPEVVDELVKIIRGFGKG